MRQLTREFVSFMKKEDGPTAVEYAALLSLIVVVCIVAITSIGKNANDTFVIVGNEIQPGGAGS